MPILKSYFNSTQISLLVLGGIFLLGSLVLHLRNRERFSLLFLGLTALCVFSFAALLDPFLNVWDERFHALVAKNLLKHPLKPTLYDDPVVKMDYDVWDKYHIWLHKPPLFLWQIALSFKVFGVSEFTLRLPSVLLGVILVLVTYRSGALLVNKQVGYVSALLTLSTLYLLELVAGRQELDHNDFSFLAYVSLSIWAWVEYHFSEEKKWVYLIGLFSGMAILCKWLVGLLVYFGWGVLRITQKRIKLSENKDFILSLFITILIALPWQIFILIQYPAEAIKAYEFFSLHFSKPLEGHDGSFWYHFDKINTIYGKFASLLVVPALIALFKTGKDKNLVVSLFSMIAVVYLFFSLAATKMPSFTVIVSMIIFIAFASLFDYIIRFVYQRLPQAKHWIFILSILTITLLRFDVEFLQERHTLWKPSNYYTRGLSRNKEIFQSLNLPSNTVLLNLKGDHYIEAMFYTDLPAYNFIPSLEQYQDLKNQQRNIAIFITSNTEIPDYLKNDPSIRFLNYEIQKCE